MDNLAMVEEALDRFSGHFREALEELLPSSRERSLAITRHEESVFWMHAALDAEEAKNQAVGAPSE